MRPPTCILAYLTQNRKLERTFRNSFQLRSLVNRRLSVVQHFPRVRFPNSVFFSIVCFSQNLFFFGLIIRKNHKKILYEYIKLFWDHILVAHNHILEAARFTKICAVGCDSGAFTSGSLFLFIDVKMITLIIDPFWFLLIPYFWFVCGISFIVPHSLLSHSTC